MDNVAELSYIFTQINCKLAFTNQYYHNVPCLLVLAIYMILENELILSKYLKEKVMDVLNG